MLYAALDTNIFLHYQHFTTVPWSKILGAEAIVTVLPTVYDELEAKRYDSSDSRIKKRAAEISKAIYKAAQAGSVHAADPSDFPKDVHAQVPNNDYDLRIIDEALAFQSIHAHDEVLIVTADNPMKLKAKARDVRFFEMPDDLKLPDDDERDRELQKARVELDHLKNAIPRVSLTFQGGKTRITFAPVDAAPPDPEWFEAEVKAKTERLKSKSTSMHPAEDYERKWHEYVAKHAKYLTKFRAYLLDEWRLENRIFALPFVVHNPGPVRATDIDVNLHFPGDFMVTEKIKAAVEPDAPDPPLTIEESLLGFAKGGFNFASLVPDYPNLFPKTAKPTIPDFSSLRIKKTNSYDVTYLVHSVKQGLKSEPMMLFLIYADSAKPKSFAIDSEVIVGNGYGKITRDLHVIFEPNRA